MIPKLAEVPNLDEDAWDDLLNYIEERRVIPIIGPELLRVETEEGPRAKRAVRVRTANGFSDLLGLIGFEHRRNSRAGHIHDLRTPKNLENSRAFGLTYEGIALPCHHIEFHRQWACPRVSRG